MQVKVAQDTHTSAQKVTVKMSAIHKVKNGFFHLCPQTPVQPSQIYEKSEIHSHSIVLLYKELSDSLLLSCLLYTYKVSHIEFFRL